jgi:hypothetical protein
LSDGQHLEDVSVSLAGRYPYLCWFFVEISSWFSWYVFVNSNSFSVFQAESCTNVPLVQSLSSMICMVGVKRFRLWPMRGNYCCFFQFCTCRDDDAGTKHCVKLSYANY